MPTMPKLPEFGGLLQFVPEVLSDQPLIRTTCGPPATGTERLPVQVEIVPLVRSQVRFAFEVSLAQMPPLFGLSVTSPFGGAPGELKSTSTSTPTVQSTSSLT